MRHINIIKRIYKRTTSGYQAEDIYGGRLKNPTPGFIPMFNDKKDLITEKNKHEDLPAQN